MFNKQSLSAQVEDALRREISQGKVLPGQRVSIANYQDTWKISSTPFRDAIRALEIQGFVTVEPRKGVYVAPMNRETVREIFELRIAFECMATELATPIVPQDKAEGIRDAYIKARDAQREHGQAELAAIDMFVHDLAREYCGNRRLQRLLVGQMDLFRWAQNTIIQEMPRSYEAALPEHIAIMTAVCARDPRRASEAMREHLENSRRRLEAMLRHQETLKQRSNT
jgi:DNA-binding GntR family transcriptional regulator